MGKTLETRIQIGGKEGIIFHDKLCCDGPIDPTTGEPMIDPATGEPYDGPNDDLAYLMHDYLVKVRSNVLSGSEGYLVPRYGVLTELAANTPIFVYDHPALAGLSKTAFTDGHHVFVYADFMRELIVQEQEYDGKKSGVVFLLLHELMHKLLKHTERMQGYNNRIIPNVAQDLVINGRLIKGYPGLSPVPALLEFGVGMKSTEAEKYFTMSEELVCEMLLINERKRQLKQERHNKKKGEGSGDGGSENNSDMGEGSRSGRRRRKEGEEGDAVNQELSDMMDRANELEKESIHHVTLEELLDVLEENNLTDTVGKALNLPDRKDKEALDGFKEKGRLNDMDIVQKALARSRLLGDHYPGKSIAEEASDIIMDIGKGKLTWLLGAQRLVSDGGFKEKHSDDEASLLWYVDKDVTGLDAFYEGSPIPAKNNEVILALIDTSGSTMGGRMRSEFLQEILGLKEGNAGRDSAAKVILLSADSILRGEPIEITKQNVKNLRDNGVPVFGNAGTDFVTCLDQAVELPILKKEKIRSILYFTDCCDSPPSKEDFEKYLDKGVKIAFFTVPSMYNESWNMAVKGWADVYQISEDEKVVDLSVNPVNVNANKLR